MEISDVSDGLFISFCLSEPESTRHTGYLNYALKYGHKTGIKFGIDSQELFLDITFDNEVKRLTDGLSCVLSDNKDFQFLPADDEEFVISAHKKNGLIEVTLTIIEERGVLRNDTTVNLLITPATMTEFISGILKEYNLIVKS